MPIQIYLSKPEGMAFFIKDLTPEAETDLRRAMSAKKAPVIKLELLTGKQVIVRADMILMTRQVSQEDYEKAKAERDADRELDREAAERHRRMITPAVPRGRIS